MSLDALRSEIDEIDDKIVSLLHRRAAIAGDVGSVKAKAGLPIVDREREAAIMRRIAGPSYSPIETAVILRIYAEILLESRRIQQRATKRSDAGEIV